MRRLPRLCSRVGLPAHPKGKASLRSGASSYGVMANRVAPSRRASSFLYLLCGLLHNRLVASF